MAANPRRPSSDSVFKLYGKNQQQPQTMNRPRAPAMIMKRDADDLGLPADAMKQPDKKKTPQFDFRYDDTDTLMSELEEFYPYVEMKDIAKNPAKFEGSFDGKWTEASLPRRKAHVELLLEQFESPSLPTRRLAQGQLLYLIQGCFAETTSPEEQLHWVIETAKTVRAVDGVAVIVYGLRDAARRYNLSEKPPLGVEEKAEEASMPAGTVPAQVDPYDDRSAELMDLLAMLYTIVEVLRTDDSFGDELMAITPPLPMMLLQMLSTLRDKIPKAYPVKKFMLLLWKTLLACLGGMREVQDAMCLSREWAGLPRESKNFTKASPIDIANWRRDTSVKYPTFSPTQPAPVPAPSDDIGSWSNSFEAYGYASAVPNEKLAESIQPIPPRPNYHSTDLPPAVPRPMSSAYGTTTQLSGGLPMPGTPAPSPPPSPAPQQGPQPKKKQQYQTDPSRPFIFPYSRTSAGAPASLVPFAISEAESLYRRHEYVSLGLVQLWQVREEYIREERGLGKSGLIGFSNGYDRLGGDEEGDEEDVEAMMREWKYEQEEMECEEKGDREGAKRARGKRMSAKRLRRVDIIHRDTLPILHACVVALLKLLLATVTSPPGSGAPGTGPAGLGGMPVGLQSPGQEPAEQPSLPTSQEDIDIARHREITSKAVSAILLLLLKWFKASHILKFHLLTQLLFDSNAMLLLLKMFGLSDSLGVVTARNEIEELSFFHYCASLYNQSSPDPSLSNADPTNIMTGPPRPSRRRAGPVPEGAEFTNDYSWRNFFSTINFLKVLQKITKHRSHRTFVMSTYKSWPMLKRILKVNHPMLQLQVLKLIKSQMPWFGRKWRQATGNMKVITSIYLNCRPDLRDEWLAGTDQETELEDAVPQDNSLRTLVQFYNMQHYIPPTPQSPDISHSHSQQRQSSSSHINPLFEDPVLSTNGHTDPSSHLHPHPRSGSSSSSGEDVFPPRRTKSSFSSSDAHIDGQEGKYNPDEMIDFWLHEYEDVLGEVFGMEGENEVLDEFGLNGALAGLSFEMKRTAKGEEEEEDDVDGKGGTTPGVDDRAWHRLNEIMNRGEEEEDISDNESVVTVGELGEEAHLGATAFGERRNADGSGRRGSGSEERGDNDSRVGMGVGRRRSGPGENTWEHMSPSLRLLPRSPIERRRSSSSGSPLRPVMASPLINGNSNYEDPFDEEDEMDQRGPMPIKMDTKDHEEREGGAVDEVEYTYGE